MNRRGFFKLLGKGAAVVGLAPAIPTVVMAATPVPVAAPALAAIAAFSLSMERMTSAVRACAEYFQDIDEAISAEVRAHVRIELYGNVKVEPGEELDRAWLLARARGETKGLIEEMPEGMRFIVNSVEHRAEATTETLTIIEATECAG